MMTLSPQRTLFILFFLFALGAINPVWGQTLNFGQTVSQSLDAPGEVDVFTFAAEAGDRVMIAMGRTVGTFQPQIILRTDAEVLVCQSANTSGASAEINGCLISDPGSYKIYAGDYGNTQTGNYLISLQRLNNPVNASPLAFGQTLSSNISNAAELDAFTFSGVAGDRVMIAGAITLGLIDPQIRLYRPGGTMICEAFYGTGGMAEINDCALPVDGTYTILFADYQYTETGNYGIYLQRLNNPGNASALTYGQTAVGDISLVPEMDAYTLSGEAGQRVMIAMAVTLGALDPQIRLFRPDGTLLCAGTVAGVSAEINGCLLPSTGTYTLLVNDVGDTEIGNYRLYLQRLTGGANPTPLSFGLPVTTDIALAAEMDTFTFTAAAGDRVLINMAISSGLLDPQVRLYGPNGTLVCQTSSTSGGVAEISECLITESGTHQILASDYGNTETGNYGIFLQRLNQPGNATAISYGQTITRDITYPSEMDTFTFVGSANDRVLIDMAVTLGTLDPQIRLYRPDGTPLCTASHDSGGSAEIYHCTLPETGTYTFLAHDYGHTEVGNYRIYLQRLSNPVNASPISFGQNLPADIALAAEMDAFTFNASVGDRIIIAMAISSGLLDPQIRLYDQAGNLICQAYYTNGGAAEINDCPLPVDGTYIILTNDYGNTETGNYGIYVQRLNNPSGVTALTYGQTISRDILAPSEMDTFTFFGTAGERILIDMAVTLGALDPQVRLYRPNGNLLCSNVNTSGGSTEIHDCSLTDTGTYVLLANDQGNRDTGNYRIYFQRLSNPVNTSPLTFGQTLTGDIALAAEMDVYTFNAFTGDRVMIAMAISSGSLDPQIRLYDPSGSLICQANYTNGGFAEINDCPLPTDGIYVTIVNDYGNTETGNYGLFLQKLHDSINSSPLGFGQTLNGEINQAGEMKTLSFQATANDRVIFSMKANSGTLDPQIRVYRLNGTLLCSGHSSNGESAQTNTCVFPETGIYTILTNDYGNTETGGFTLMSRLPESGMLDITPVTDLTSSSPNSGHFFPSAIFYTLKNIGGGTINWTVSKTQPWVSLSETSGILPLGETKTIIVTINQEANYLSAGFHFDTITFQNTTNGNGNATRSVNLSVDQTEYDWRKFLPIIIKK